MTPRISYQREFRIPLVHGPHKLVDASEARELIERGKAERLSVQLEPGGPAMPLASLEDLAELQAFQAGEPPENRPVPEEVD